MKFLKLIRITNLMVIILTMVGVADYLLKMHSHQKVNFNFTHYVLLILSTVLIAAAGNMINDYFDIKADRVNKPNRLIVSKYIKKRWVIILHWTFNLVAFIIGVFLSYHYNSLVFAFIHLLSINMLWFYSTYFKKKMLLGNGMIGLLTAFVPLLSLCFFSVLNAPGVPNSADPEVDLTSVINHNFIFLLAVCAGIQNFGREIVKDAEDIEGDKLIQVKSLAIKLGVRTSVLIALGFIQLTTVFGFLFFYTTNDPLNGSEIFFFISSGTVNGLLLLAYLFNQKIKISHVQLTLKLSMLIGLSSLFSTYIS